MRLNDLAARLLRLSKVLHAWLELLTGLDTARRRRISIYADEIAATLGRAADALARLNIEADNKARAPAASHQQARELRRELSRELSRELGRIAGYVEDIVFLLEDHLDGRKLAGVKRRLQALAGLGCDAEIAVAPELAVTMTGHHIKRLSEAEGYFRSLADGLRI